MDWAGGEPGVRTLALGISPELIQHGVINLRGGLVRSAQDLATLAQVFRDPRFETFRIIYLKGDQIVGHEGMTSRLPGTVKVLTPGRPELRRMADRMTELGADGYWILHNHPSGKSEPSVQDRILTQVILEAVPGFKGHVVIDSGEYSLIPPGLTEGTIGAGRTEHLDAGLDLLLTPVLPHALLDTLITSETDVVRIGKAIQSPTGFVTVVYRSGHGTVRAIQEIPLDLFNDHDRIGPYLRQQAQAFGGVHILTYTQPTGDALTDLKTGESAAALLDDGYLLDHVTDHGRQASSLRSNRPPQPLREPKVLGLTDADIVSERVAEQKAPYDTERPPAYDLPPMSRFDDIIRTLQDKNIDTKRLVEAIRATGAEVKDDLNPVLREEMYLSRTAQRTRDFMTDELEPTINMLRLNKVSLKDTDNYMAARHIINDKVNAHLKEINPDRENSEALSGKTDAEAQAILDAAPPVMEHIAKRIDAMVRQNRALMVAYGLEAQATVDRWAETYAFYVPLKRAGFDDAMGTGRGRDIRGSTVRDRTGSHRAVVDVLANLAQERERVIVRGEKMRPVIALAGLLMQHPNKALASLAKPAPITITNEQTGLQEVVPGDFADYRVPMISSINRKTGLVEHRPDPAYKGRDNVVNFRLQGKDYAIVFNERNDRAMEIARALKDLDVGQLNTWLSAVAPVTRYLAAINTQYNPIFGIVNFVRDVQFAMLALGSTPLAGQRAKILAHTTRAIHGIYTDARAIRRGQHPDSKVAQLWERFEHVGGPTGYRDLFRTANERSRDIEHLLDPDWWQKTAAGRVLTAGGLLAKPETLLLEKVGRPLFQWLSDYNQTMENAVRLGVFQAGLEQGMSDLAAASLAKNITVNFNKKGQISAQMGAMYAFFNASVQGTARLAETLFEPGKLGTLSALGKKIIAGGVTLGVIQAFALAMAGFDDDEPPEFVKARRLILPAPGTEKGYVSWPMPLGFNILPNLGRLAAETIMYGKPLDHAAKFMGALVDTFSPVGGAGSVAQALSPTAADPLIALSENRNWTGKPISREDFDSRHPTPGFTRAHTTASPWARGLAEAINYATGGTDYKPGLLSPTPDAIDYLIAQATGGVGRETSKAAAVISGVSRGEDVPLHKVPLVGIFAGSAGDATAVRSKFYDNLRTLNLHEAEIKGRLRHHEPIGDYRRAHPEAALVTAASGVERTVSQLNKQKHEMIQRGDSRERVKLLEERIRAMMRRFNATVEAR